MPAILTTNFSVINAENFINSMNITSGTDTSLSANYYIAIGRGYLVSSVGTTSDEELKKYVVENDVKVYSASATGTALQSVACTPDEYKQWTIGSGTTRQQSENNPPTPEDTENSKNDFKNNIMMIKKIYKKDACIVVPRVNWTSGNQYDVLDETQNPGKRAKNYFVMNSEYDVWMLVAKGSSATVASDEPIYSSLASGSSIYVGTDAYQWRYMYKITQDYVNKGMLLDDWMPVPFEKFGYVSDITSRQYTKGDPEANRTLGAYRVLVSVTLGSEDKLKAGSIYRQVGILADPRKDETGNVLGTRVTGDAYTKSEYDTDSGEVIYLENRKPIMRSDDQSETLELLVIF